MSKYIFVNKNLMVPLVIRDLTYNEAVELLQSFNNNDKNMIYIVEVNNNNIYYLKNNIIKKKGYKTNIKVDNKHKDDKDDKEDKETKEKIDNLYKLYGEIKILFEEEYKNMIKIENHIRIIEKKEESIIKRSRNKINDKLVLFRGEYKIYKNFINNNMEDIPEMFEKKYNYIKKMEEDVYYKIIMEEIEKIDVDEYNNNIKYEISDDIIEFLEKYEEKSKSLKYEFEHSYDDMMIDIME